MGRLPSMYAGRQITYRVPWVMTGSILLPIVDEPTVPFVVRAIDDNALRHANDKPFEIHRMIPRSIGLDADGEALSVANQIVQLANIDLLLRERRTNQPLMAEATAISNLVKGTLEQTWEWADPFTVISGGGFRANCSLRATDITFIDEDAVAMNLTLTFQGFLLVLAPGAGPGSKNDGRN